MKVICINGIAHFETADGVVWGDKFSADERENILNLADILRKEAALAYDPIFAVADFILQNYAIEPKRHNVNFELTKIENIIDETTN